MEPKYIMRVSVCIRKKALRVNLDPKRAQPRYNARKIAFTAFRSARHLEWRCIVAGYMLARRHVVSLSRSLQIDGNIARVPLDPQYIRGGMDTSALACSGKECSGPFPPNRKDRIACPF